MRIRENGRERATHRLLRDLLPRSRLSIGPNFVFLRYLALLKLESECFDGKSDRTLTVVDPDAFVS